MHILIAVNAFKNSLTADAAARAIGLGLQQSRLACSCEYFPVGDGGDGTASLLVHCLGGQAVNVKAHDPLGRAITGSLGLLDAGTAVFELADFSGLRLLRDDELNPLRATTIGAGEAIRHALDMNLRRIVLGIGGSATVDGAAGLLHALGARFRNAAGEIIGPQPEDLLQLASIDLSGLDARLSACEFTVMCDVDNPLLGKGGAAEIFGPQKGASPVQVQTLEAAMMRLAAAIYRHTGRDVAQLQHAGAAGGVAAGLHGLLNARLVNGIEYFLDVTNFNSRLQTADLVITGEGHIDEQTLQGKAPFGVALRAKAMNIPVVALAGRVPPQADAQLQRYFDVLLPIGAEPVELAEAMRRTAKDLQRTARQLGNLLALRSKQ